MFHDFAAGADALIWLYVRAGRDFLQKYLNRFTAFFTFESQDAGWFIHDGLLVCGLNISKNDAVNDRF
jgi:hypothetical protein